MAKKIVIGFSILIMAVLISLPLVYADDDNDDNGDNNSGNGKNSLKGVEKIIERLENFEIPEVDDASERPSSMGINKHGKVNINNGEVMSIASSTLEVKVWGVIFTVDASMARILPANTILGDIATGDRVNIKGVINTDTGVISAGKVHALSNRNRLISNLQAQIDALLERLNALRGKLLGETNTE